MSFPQLPPILPHLPPLSTFVHHQTLGPVSPAGSLMSNAPLSAGSKRPRSSFWATVLDAPPPTAALLTSPAVSPVSPMPNRSHTCGTCGLTFGRAGHLRAHARTAHARSKPFSCERCPATFGHVSSKYRHFRTVHLKRRDFTCNKCGLRFGEKSGLSKHCRTVHEGARPYPCHVCGFRFHFKLHLAQHVSTVHEKKRPHRCEVCDASFGQRSSLNRHRRQIHGSDTRAQRARS